jgi:hypothetical protein
MSSPFDDLAAPRTAFLNIEQVTPSDVVPIATAKPFYLRAGTGGTLVVFNQAGTAINLGTVSDGYRCESIVYGVKSTGTSATNITKHY